MFSIIFRSLLVFLLLCTNFAFSSDAYPGLLGYGKTASEAYTNCANPDPTNAWNENGSCDYIDNTSPSTTLKCSTLVSATFPYWRCGNATVYCSISGKTTYRSECITSSTNTCNGSTQWFNAATGRCNVKTVCIGSQTYNNSNNTCNDPVCSSGTVLDPVLKTCVSSLTCIAPKIPNPGGTACVYPETYNCEDTPQLDVFYPNGTLDNPTPRCDCANGYIYVDLNGDGITECAPQIVCDINSPDHQGTISGIQLCSNESYCDVGYTFGFVGPGNNPVPTCVPNQPNGVNCADGTYLVNGICSSPEADDILPTVTSSTTNNPDGSTTTSTSETTTGTNGSNGQTTQTTVTTSTTTQPNGTSTTTTTTTDNVLPPDHDIIPDLLTDISGSLNSITSMGTIDAYNEIPQQQFTYFNQLANVPIIAVGDNIVNAFNRPDTTCPHYEFNLSFFGNIVNLDFDIICDLWQNIENVVRNIFKLAWVVLGFFIILSA